MMTRNEYAAIAELDLTNIKTKLMHRQSGEGWSAARADAVEREYRRFLYLAKVFPTEQLAPLVDVDTFWHYHILDTRKYVADCEHVFGCFLHHYPYLGMGDEADQQARLQSGERASALYEETFGEKYGLAVQACRDQQQAAGASPAFGGVKAALAFCGESTALAFCGETTALAFCGESTALAFCGETTALAFCGETTARSFREATTALTFYGVSTDRVIAAAPSCGDKASDRAVFRINMGQLSRPASRSGARHAV